MRAHSAFYLVTQHRSAPPPTNAAQVVARKKQTHTQCETARWPQQNASTAAGPPRQVTSSTTSTSAIAMQDHGLDVSPNTPYSLSLALLHYFLTNLHLILTHMLRLLLPRRVHIPLPPLPLALSKLPMPLSAHYLTSSLTLHHLPLLPTPISLGTSRP